jgi:hypothetical protein
MSSLDMSATIRSLPPHGYVQVFCFCHIRPCCESPRSEFHRAVILVVSKVSQTHIGGIAEAETCHVSLERRF